MKSIVTGATGFLGIHLVEALIARGDKVIAIGRNTEIGEYLISIGAQFVRADIGQIESLNRSFEPADVLFHCAAFSSAWGQTNEFYRTNVKGTHNVMHVAQNNKVKRFIYVSSSSVYFNKKDRFNIDEQTELPKRFINAYAETKFLGERVVLDERTSDIESVIIRPRGIIGEHDKAIMPRLLRIARGGFFPLFNNGKALVDVTYVKNVVHALLLCSQVANIDGECFNISNDEPTKVKDLLLSVFTATSVSVKFIKLPYFLVEQLASFMEFWSSKTHGQEPILTCYGVSLLAKSQTLNIEKAKNILGYRPIYSLQEGIERYANWSKQQNV